MFKKAAKYISLVLLFGVIAALVVRVMISSDYSVFDDFTVTDASRDAYAESSSLSVYERPMKDRLAESGYFSAYSLFFVKETGEVQVSVRYNTSALGYTDTDTEEELRFWLVLRDASASGESDESDTSSKEARLNGFKGTYYSPASEESKERYGFYRYRKLIFENIPLSDEDLQKYDMLVIMTNADVSDPTSESASATVDSESYGDFLDRQYVRYAAQEDKLYSLSRRELEALSK